LVAVSIPPSIKDPLSKLASADAIFFSDLHDVRSTFFLRKVADAPPFHSVGIDGFTWPAAGQNKERN
jgi:hypothetical protein